MPSTRPEVPTVVILLTGGVATSGQNSARAATELSSIAPAPLSQHLTTVKSFEQIPTIVDRIQVASCAAAITIDTGSGSGGISVGQCEFKFFTSSCALLGSLEIEVTTLTGWVHAYAGETSQPGPVTHLVKDESADAVKLLQVPNPGSAQNYIGIKGIDTNSTFKLRMRDNPAARGTLVWQGPGVYAGGAAVYSFAGRGRGRAPAVRAPDHGGAQRLRLRRR